MTLKLHTYIKSVSVINNNIEKLSLNFILWSFMALSLLYVFFLGNMVSNIVERRSLEREALTLAGEVAEFELTYLSMSNNIDYTFSQTLGFKETKPIFANKKPIGLQIDPPSSIKTSTNDL